MIAAMRIDRSKLPRSLLWIVGVLAAWVNKH
jgi:hypothetical protein